MKSFKEALKGNQHKLDKNKNGKLDSHDFKLLRKEEEQIDEVEKATGDLKDACWKGYTAVGMKKKNGKMVPNCVPEEIEFSMTAEEFEQLDEISKKTLGSYISKASVDMANRSAEGERKRTMAGADYAHNISRGMSAKTAEVGMKKDYDAAKPDVKKSVQRMRGIDKAVGRLAKEEVEELDELSKSTLASYAKKSSNDARMSGQIAKDFENKSTSYRKPEMKSAAARLSGEYKKRAWKREDGTMKAIDRLAKEEAEQIDEISLDLAKRARDKAAHYVDMDHDDLRMKAFGDSEKQRIKFQKYVDKKETKPAKVMAKEEVELDEATPTKQQVKQGIGIARDKRYAGGNVTGAVKAMDKLNKGIAQHPVVKKELQKQNEELEEKMDIAKAKMGDVIKDFQNSDAPQFAGKSAEKRRQMAVAAKLAADRQANESMSFAAYMKLEETAEIELIELDEMIGYSDFQSKIDAHKKAGNRVVDSKYGSDKAHYTVVDKEGTARKVIHTARGTQMQNLGNVKGDDDSDESPKGEKRGRGRPKGSKSGASGPRIK